MEPSVSGSISTQGPKKVYTTSPCSLTQYGLLIADPASSDKTSDGEKEGKMTESARKIQRLFCTLPKSQEMVLKDFFPPFSSL